MKAFRFSLQALWVLRGQEEELARHRFAESFRAVQAAAARVEEARQQMWTAADRFRASTEQGTQAGTLQQDLSWFRQLQEVFRRRIQSWQTACQASEKAWQELLQVRRNRETLDRYRTRQRQAWLLALQRSEQKELDELAQQRHVRAEIGQRFRPDSPRGPV
ncbi:MAG: flagellar FliJ family protein [Verrucomicrobiota bacterium]|nr:flagellar FliJ family protein [Limisphaera sp.]MDW8381041.1 flagellar FliJ family protein [Verrucomicrobiota bacterium]